VSLQPIPTTAKAVDKDGNLVPAYQAWFSSIQYWLSPVGSNGTTALRPINTAPTRFLYIGQTYFDTTLGKPIFVKSLNPTVWVDATGGVV
jgi:hypothetical protein